ncbi:hypothetical protein BG005_001068 [Podila minutissima]|nr:hypothetical protein BG005_001068 [Podila minutissima]
MQPTSRFEQHMASPNEAVPYAFQDFKTEDGEPLQQMPVQICSETGLKCIFWQDVRNTFQGVDCLHGPEYMTERAHRVIMFMVGQNGEVLQPLRIECASDAYQVIYHKQQEQLPALELQNRYRS